VHEGEKKLQIVSASESHAGSYVCAAGNEAGETRRTFEVEILVAPHIDESVHKRRLEVLEGEKVKLGCPVRSVPTPTSISWVRVREVGEVRQKTETV
jgi:hypothetical protein